MFVFYAGYVAPYTETYTETYFRREVMDDGVIATTRTIIFNMLFVASLDLFSEMNILMNETLRHIITLYMKRFCLVKVSKTLF